MPNFSRDDIVSTSRKEKTSYSRSANSGTSASMSQREVPSKQASKNTTRSYSDRDDLVRVQARRETRGPIASAAARKQSDKAARKAVFQQVWAQYLGAGPAPANRAQAKDKSLYKNIQDRDFTPGDKESFVAAMMPHALQVSRQTGVDPKIVIAQAALETGWGKSAPGNNFFGVKSHGKSGGGTYATTEYVNGAPVQIRDAFRGYRGMGESVRDYGRFLKENPRYGEMLSAENLEDQIDSLGRSGYATDPEYASKIHQIAKGIDLEGKAAADHHGLRPKARPEAWRKLIESSEGRGDLEAADGPPEGPGPDLGGLRPQARPAEWEANLMRPKARPRGAPGRDPAPSEGTYISAGPYENGAGSGTTFNKQLPAAPIEDMETYVRDGLVRRGIPLHIAEGFVMNFKSESSLDPGQPGDKGHSFGLAQWYKTRKDDLFRFAEKMDMSPAHPDVQLDFLIHELTGKQAGAWRKIRETESVPEAAVAILKHFEVPAKEHRIRREREYLGIDE